MNDKQHIQVSGKSFAQHYILEKSLQEILRALKKSSFSKETTYVI